MLARVEVGVALPTAAEEEEEVGPPLLLGRWLRGGGLRRFLGLRVLPLLLRGLLAGGLVTASLCSVRGDVAGSESAVVVDGGDCAGGSAASSPRALPPSVSLLPLSVLCSTLKCELGLSTSGACSVCAPPSPNDDDDVVGGVDADVDDALAAADRRGDRAATDAAVAPGALARDGGGGACVKSWRHMGQQRETFSHPARHGPWNKCLQGVKRTSLSGPKTSMQIGQVWASPSWSGARSSSSSGEGLSVCTTRHTSRVPDGAALLVTKAPERMRTTKMAVEREVMMHAIASAKPVHAKRADAL